MDNEEIFTTSFQAGRKRIYVDVKENHAGTYLKIKERGDSQSNNILIPSGSIVELRNALDEAVQALESLDASKGGAAGGASAASPANQCVCHVGNLSWDTTDDTLHDLFSGYGEVVKAEVQMSRAGRSQGWGLVEFASAAEVEYGCGVLGTYAASTPSKRPGPPQIAPRRRIRTQVRHLTVRRPRSRRSRDPRPRRQGPRGQRSGRAGEDEKTKTDPAQRRRQGRGPGPHLRDEP